MAPAVCCASTGWRVYGSALSAAGLEVSHLARCTHTYTPSSVNLTCRCEFWCSSTPSVNSMCLSVCSAQHINYLITLLGNHLGLVWRLFFHTFMWTCTHVNTRIHVRAGTHTPTHTHTHTHTPTHTHRQTQPNTHTGKHRQTHTRSQTHTHAQTHTHSQTHTQTHSQTHTSTHTRTHTHTHNQ